MLHPFKFRPHLKSVLWGGDKIVRFKGLKTRQRMIGESWEISGVEGRESIVAGGPDAGRSLVELIARYKWSLVGEEVYRRFGSTFPLLVKFIDARQDLSVQVHPGDELARRRHNAMGKTEMWYVIDADAGARIGCGLSQPITTEDYERRVADKSIMDVVALHESHRGDVFYIPSGRIHTIGAGNFVAEIQQTSDITYRIYDYDRCDPMGNPRELHTQLAREAIDFNVADDYCLHYGAKDTAGSERLMVCPYFQVWRHVLTRDFPVVCNQLDSFLIVMCIAGEAVAVSPDGHETHVRRGETILVPAEAAPLTLRGEAQLITASVR
ncbi:MAG: class I mannose-6-phosphate isomerase [Muribaculaceae bacterium]|nr:class I mannose-6-phosphate isomerase [Muribaculaceae bacterium]